MRPNLQSVHTMKSFDIEIVTTAGLKPLLNQRGEAPAVVDVRLEADFKRRHLRGAKNNCVYEVGFVEHMAAIAPDKSRAVLVYGDGPHTHEARMAAEKLVRAGYAKVIQSRDGPAEFVEAGLPVEETAGEPEAEAPPRPDGRKKVDLAESRLQWTGRNLLNRHRGTLQMKSGHLDFEDGTLIGGEFAFDINAITCENLKGDPLHDILVDHLRSHDFFDTEIFPEARFRLVRVEQVAGATAGSPNLRIEGELTLKDRTGPVAFEAVAGLADKGKFAAQAVLSFDRTQWNVLYGSGKFFSNLGMHLVNDLIEIEVRMVTE